MGKGYKIVEPIELGLLFTDDKYFDLSVLLFYWLIDELYLELPHYLANIELDVIRVSHLGAYPAIGVHYETPGDTRKLEPLIQSTISKILETTPVIELINFIGTTQIDWQATTAKLMDKKSRG